MATQTGFRRSPRVPLVIPITVSGKDVNDQPFREACQTLVVSNHGGLIAASRKLAKGSQIVIENPSLSRVATARVTCVADGRSPATPFEVGVEVKGAGYLWPAGIRSPAGKTGGPQGPIAANLPAATAAVPGQGISGEILQETIPHEVHRKVEGWLASSKSELEVYAAMTAEKYREQLIVDMRELVAHAESQLREMTRASLESLSEKSRSAAEESIRWLEKRLRDFKESTAREMANHLEREMERQFCLFRKDLQKGTGVSKDHLWFQVQNKAADIVREVFGGRREGNGGGSLDCPATTRRIF